MMEDRSSEVGTFSSSSPPLLPSLSSLLSSPLLRPRLSFRAKGAGTQEASPGLAQTLRKDRRSPLLCHGLTQGICFDLSGSFIKVPGLESRAWQ